MKKVNELAEKPAEFLRTTGVNYDAFTIILEKIVSYAEQYKEQNPISRLGRKGSCLDSFQALLLTLMYKRQYHTFLSLGQAFSVRESYAYKRYRHMRGILSKVLDMPPGLLTPAGPIKVAADVSEQPIVPPLKGRAAKFCFQGLVKIEFPCHYCKL